MERFVFIVVSVFGFLSIFTSFVQLVIFLSSQEKRSLVGENGLYTLFMDIGLLMLFALQHSGMATSWWKQKMAALGLEVIQRSLYVIGTAAVLQVMLRYWQPSCCYLWNVDTSEQPLLWLLFAAIHFLAWIVMYGSALIMDFSELVGLKQVYYYLLDQESPITHKSARTQRLFQHMRHGGATSLMTILWVHPSMTLSRLVMACLSTLYVLFVFGADRKDYDYTRDMFSKKQQRLSGKMD